MPLLLPLALALATQAVAALPGRTEDWDDDGRHAPCNGPCPNTSGPPDDAEEAPFAGRALRGGGVEGRVLFVVATDSNFYATRMQWVFETWASALPERDVIVIGDGPYNESLFNSSVKSTKCPAHSHNGGCCKWGMALEYIYKKMASEPDISWAYLADDDAYVRVDMVREMVAVHSDPEDTGVALGILGCGDAKCGGFCGGGGVAMNRVAVYKAVRFKLREVESEAVAWCHKCSMWADLAITNMFTSAGVDVRKQDNLRGWRLKKKEFEASLRSAIMYHYIKTHAQMSFLHGIFNESLPSLPPNNTKNTTHCVQYQGAPRCAIVPSPGDLPWDG